MIIGEYKSARRYEGVTPVFFVDRSASGLEGVVEQENERLGMSVGDVVEMPYLEISGGACCYYVHFNGKVYRIFIGQYPSGNNHGKIKSIIKVGDVSPDKFGKLFPREPNLTESQVNRKVRKTLKELA